VKITKIAAALSLIGASIPAFATNGMNMEGYGPVATGMGGASFAYDNGNAGMINNPATLGFMKSGTSRLDLAIGGLHPSVSSNGKDSSADAFFMPAFGYVRKDGNLSWGAGMMAQGGMGTDYSNGSFLGTTATSSPFAATGFAAGQGALALAQGQSLQNMSEVGVGRVIFPLAYQVNDQFNLGGSIDYVWAGMDIKWLVDGAHFQDMMPGSANRFGRVSGSFITNGLMPNIGVMFDQFAYGYFDFANTNKFSQKAKGDGWAANLGFTYKVSPQLTVGGIYHAKTRLSDMETGSQDASMTLSFNDMLNLMGGGANSAAALPVKGKIVVRNFQWPETYGFGFAYTANDKWSFAADYKRINWASVMKSFRMSFIAGGNGGVAGGFNGMQMDMDYFQNWKNQNVFMFGAEYKYSDALAVRVGANLANNPVPNEYMTALFPAIVKNHLTFGAAYKLDKAASVDFSLTHAPKVSATNSAAAIGTPAGAVGAVSNQSVSHSQTNWQLMYGYRF